MTITSTTAARGVLADLTAAATPFLFLTGKGGVGKTSIAAAVSLALTETGKRVLLVSTDPASNLDEVLGVDAGSSPVPVGVPGLEGLQVLNIDPVAAAAAYRERVVGPYRGVLPDGVVARMDEELSGSCTVEIAAFNEFVTLLADPTTTEGFDHVVFDTAPTGHTLRLLTLPGAWTGFLATNTAGVTCIGPVSALGQAQDRYAAAVEALRDGARTTVVLVTRPERGAVAEAARAATELAALGLTHQRLVINGVFTATDPHDRLAAALQTRARDAIRHLPSALRSVIAVDQVPLLPAAPIGVSGLRALLRPALAGDAGAGPASEDSSGAALPGLAGLVDELAAAGSGVVMTMGKGGVGKTTLAAAIAVELAARGHPVTLTTTDPAAHVTAVLPDPPPGVTVTRIDPTVETAAYTATVLAQAGQGLTPEAHALLEEDLRSPCTEEVAVFQAFARSVAGAGNRFVVIDTAPTGHTLLLLDASQGFTRQIAAQSGHVPDAASALLDTLKDADKTRILLVTLPEATPVHEARTLQADLERAGITPFAWVINSTLVGTTTSDPVLHARADAEQRWINDVQAAHPAHLAIVPWSPTMTVGTQALRELTRTLSASGTH
jgi:arsenite-transporting ATPase